MRILLTGANGLLGRCVLRALAGGHEVAATGHARLAPGLTPLDITDPGAVARVAKGGRFTHIVNCAADRSPEHCRDHAEEAYRLNALAVEHLGAAADRIGALLCQISTDYVFPGTHPPYREDDMPLPVNLYGRTKLAGEYAARRAARHLVLRVPALYRTDLGDDRNTASEFARWLRAGERRPQDAATIRYYTLADDVADAVRFALEKGCEGILHLSAEQRTTKAEFGRKIAAAIGCDPAQVTDAGPPAHEDRRPHDSHLDPGRYLALGGRPFTDIETALRRISG